VTCTATEDATVPNFYAFAGPYLEILAPLERDINWSDDEYDKLHSRLKWLNGRGDPKPVEIAGRKVWQHCGFPERQEFGIPRSPMYFPMPDAFSGKNAVADLRGADIPAEIAWFENAFAVELDIVSRTAAIHGFEYGVRWGMVCYVY